MSVIRYRTYNGTTRYKVRNPYFTGRGSFVCGISDDQGSDTTLSLSLVSKHDVTCFDGGDGSITVEATGGVPPYQYSKDNVSWQSSPTFSNLSITAPVTESVDGYGGILICPKTIYVKDSGNNVESVVVQLKSPVQLDWVNTPESHIYRFYDPGENYATIVVQDLNVDLTTTANIQNGFIAISGIHSDNKYTNGEYSVNCQTANTCGESLNATIAISVYPLFYPNAIQDRDLNWYDAVVIGDQVWLAQNLRTTKYADGTPILNGGTNTSSSTPYYYDNTSSNIPLRFRGYYYNWAAVMRGSSSSSSTPSGVQGLAPAGWHIPSVGEYYQLLNYVNSHYNTSTQGFGSFCYTDYWPTAKNNKTLFGAVPAGYYTNENSLFGDVGYSFNAWSSTEYEYDNNYAKGYKLLGFSSGSVSENTLNVYKYCGLSVRCVYNNSPLNFVNWYYNEYGSYNHQVS